MLENAVIATLLILCRILKANCHHVVNFHVFQENQVHYLLHLVYKMALNHTKKNKVFINKKFLTKFTSNSSAVFG